VKRRAYLFITSAMHKNNRLEEAQILELLKLGDSAAVEYWLTEYENPLAAYISQKVDLPADTKELTQETFVACLKQLPLFRGDSSILTWMISIARHQIADYYRKKYTKQALKFLPLSHYLFEAKIDDAHETSEKVKQVLGRMSQTSQELLQKKYVDGRKVAEIAKEWGRSVKSVESELFRARAEFRELYAQVD